MRSNTKKIKLKIIGLIFIFGICMISSVYFMSNFMKSKEKKTFETKTEEEMKKIVNEMLNSDDDNVLSDEDKYALVFGEFMNRYENSLKLGKETNKEYPKEKSDVFYNNLIKKAETAEYTDILQEIESKAHSYKFHEEYNWKIGNLYYDATLMNEVINTENENKGQMVKNMKDPTMLLIGTMFLPEEARRVVISDLDSLSPIFDGAVSIKKHEEKEVKEDEDFEDDFMNIILTESFSVEKIHRFEFEVENTSLLAYIVEHEDGSLEFYTIKQNGNYECHYKSIRYWIEIDNALK